MHRSGGLRYDGKIAGLYDLEETLGSGHFAIVKSARHVFTGEKVAVKVIDKSKLDEVSRAHLFQEVRCMKLVQHPNVVRLYEVIDTQTKLYLILELADGGDLYDYIMRHETGLAEGMAREYFRQIVRAISYCHRLHVVHRDLKPENVVFFEALGMVKLTDFGFSNRFNPGQKLETSCGSLAYSAPEILLGDSYDAPAVDVWSLGVILYMLVCGQAPFQEANDSETLTMIMDVKYTIPAHVSDGCKRLIARMLVREPERRASLAQIAGDAWLGEDVVATEPADFLPLISREHVSDEDHALIIQKMVNGNIASKEEILEALDKNEYNHITATYFLLAERKLRAHRQEQATHQQKLRNQLPPPAAPAAAAKPSVKIDASSASAVDSPAAVDQSLLSARLPGETPANLRVRKCSIVQEEEDEDDIPGGGHDATTPAALCSLNRRGSRSEGKLNLVLQERLAESERRKEAAPAGVGAGAGADPVAGITRVGVRDDSSRARQGTPVWMPAGKRNTAVAAGNAKWRMGENKKVIVVPGAYQLPMPTPTSLRTPANTTVNTTVITESSTISMPVKPSAALPVAASIPKYKTMPAPARPLHPALAAGAAAASAAPLNEIFEEGDGEDGQVSDRRGVSARTGQPRATAYEQRRSKFHKARTASCSSSDASDDDSESRKKRAHKLSAEGKPISQRRDSHDDSSDSQDPSGGGAGGGGGGGARGTECANPTATKPPAVSDNSRTTGGTGGGTESRQCPAQAPLGRRHRAGRRRAGETRLRESQSLNRITEVHEAEHPPPAAAAAAAPAAPAKTRGFGARLLHGWSLASKRSDDAAPAEPGKDERRAKPRPSPDGEEKENCKVKPEKSKGGKKVRMLSRYFQMHKKLCLPLPGIFGRGRLYKAQSCSSIMRDRVAPPSTASLVPCAEDRWRTEQIPRKAGRGGGDPSAPNGGDINQNLGIVRSTPRLDCIVPLVANCPGIKICHVHLGDVTKCCHLC